MVRTDNDNAVINRETVKHPLVKTVCLSPSRTCVFSPSSVLASHLIPVASAAFVESRWTQQKLDSQAEDHGILAPCVILLTGEQNTELPLRFEDVVRRKFSVWPYLHLPYDSRVDFRVCERWWYLRVCQSPQVRVKVELDADPGTRQSEPSDQQHSQHHIGKGCSEVDHLYRHIGWCRNRNKPKMLLLCSGTMCPASVEQIFVHGISPQDWIPPDPPFLWISPPSRCRSSTSPRRSTDTGPGPSSESPCGQCQRKSSGLFSCTHWTETQKWFVVFTILVTH